MVTLAALYTGQSLIDCVLQCQHNWRVKHVVKKNDIYLLSHYVAAREVEKRRFDLRETTDHHKPHIYQSINM